jgi:hypothetical protein
MKEVKSKSIEIKPYMISELAKFYQVSDKTIRCWLKGVEDRLGKRIGRYYTIKQVEMIFQEFGIPKTIEL